MLGLDKEIPAFDQQPQVLQHKGAGTENPGSFATNLQQQDGDDKPERQSSVESCLAIYKAN